MVFLDLFSKTCYRPTWDDFCSLTSASKVNTTESCPTFDSNINIAPLIMITAISKTNHIQGNCRVQTDQAFMLISHVSKYMCVWERVQILFLWEGVCTKVMCVYKGHYGHVRLRCSAVRYSLFAVWMVILDNDLWLNLYFFLPAKHNYTNALLCNECLK